MDDQALDKKINEIHHQMVSRLSKEIDLKTNWNSFENALRGKFVDLGNSDFSSFKVSGTYIFGVCSKLLESGNISYGDYGRLRECFERKWLDNVFAVQIIDRATENINNLRKTEKSVQGADANTEGEMETPRKRKRYLSSVDTEPAKTRAQIILENTEQYMREMQRNGGRVVQRQGIKAAIKCLKLYRITIITGISGEGKTTVAMETMRKIKEENILGSDVRLVISTDIKDLEEFGADEKLLILFENAFGDVNLNMDKSIFWMNQIKQSLQQLKRSGQLFFIFTSRQHIYKKLLQEVGLWINKGMETNLSSNFSLTVQEKRKFIHEFSVQYQRNADSELENAILQSNCSTIIGFPQLCKMFFSTPWLQDQGAKFFENPKVLLTENINNLGFLDQCVLFCCLLWKNQALQDNDHSAVMSSDVFQSFHKGKETNLPNDYDHQFQKSMETLIGTYFIQIGKVVTFSHRSVEEAVFEVFLQQYPQTVLKNCSERIICEIVNDTETNEYIKVNENCYEDLAERISDILLDETSKTTLLSFNRFTKKALIEKLFTILSRSTDELLKHKNKPIALQNMVHNCEFLEYFFQMSFHLKTKDILGVGYYFITLQIGLEKAIEIGNLASAQFLVHSGSIMEDNILDKAVLNKNDNVETVLDWLQQSNKFTTYQVSLARRMAVRHGNVQVFKSLDRVFRYNSLHSIDTNVLELAVHSGNIEMVKELSEPNIYSDTERKYAFDIACSCGNVGIVRHLYEKGFASLSPLCLENAIWSSAESSEVVKYLLENYDWSVDDIFEAMSFPQKKESPNSVMLNILKQEVQKRYEKSENLTEVKFAENLLFLAAELGNPTLMSIPLSVKLTTDQLHRALDIVVNSRFLMFEKEGISETIRCLLKAGAIVHQNHLSKVLSKAYGHELLSNILGKFLFPFPDLTDAIYDLCADDQSIGKIELLENAGGRITEKSVRLAATLGNFHIVDYWLRSSSQCSFQLAEDILCSLCNAIHYTDNPLMFSTYKSIKELLKLYVVANHSLDHSVAAKLSLFVSSALYLRDVDVLRMFPQEKLSSLYLVNVNKCIEECDFSTDSKHLELLQALVSQGYGIQESIFLDVAGSHNACLLELCILNKKWSPGQLMIAMTRVSNHRKCLRNNCSEQVHKCVLMCYRKIDVISMEREMIFKVHFTVCVFAFIYGHESLFMDMIRKHPSMEEQLLQSLYAELSRTTRKSTASKETTTNDPTLALKMIIKNGYLRIFQYFLTFTNLKHVEDLLGFTSLDTSRVLESHSRKAEMIKLVLEKSKTYPRPDELLLNAVWSNDIDLVIILIDSQPWSNAVIVESLKTAITHSYTRIESFLKMKFRGISFDLENLIVGNPCERNLNWVLINGDYRAFTNTFFEILPKIFKKETCNTTDEMALHFVRCIGPTGSWHLHDVKSALIQMIKLNFIFTVMFVHDKVGSFDIECFKGAVEEEYVRDMDVVKYIYRCQKWKAEEQTEMMKLAIRGNNINAVRLLRHEGVLFDDECLHEAFEYLQMIKLVMSYRQPGVAEKCLELAIDELPSLEVFEYIVSHQDKKDKNLLNNFMYVFKSDRSKQFCEYKEHFLTILNSYEWSSDLLDMAFSKAVESSDLRAVDDLLQLRGLRLNNVENLKSAARNGSLDMVYVLMNIHWTPEEINAIV